MAVELISTQVSGVDNKIEDLKKAISYLGREIDILEKIKNNE